MVKVINIKSLATPIPSSLRAFGGSTKVPAHAEMHGWLPKVFSQHWKLETSSYDNYNVHQTNQRNICNILCQYLQVFQCLKGRVIKINHSGTFPTSIKSINIASGFIALNRHVCLSLQYQTSISIKKTVWSYLDDRLRQRSHVQGGHLRSTPWNPPKHCW